MDSVTCPRCGTKNRAGEMNCEACRINLRFALENPAEIQRIRQVDIRRERLEGGELGNDIVRISVSKAEPTFLPALLLWPCQ